MEKIISQVNGTMSMEGMPLTDEIKKDMYRRLKEQISIDELISNAVNKYKNGD